MYMYPDNLKSKATLWLWELRDIGIIGVGCLISVFALSQLGWLPPIVLTALYAFLSIRFEDVSILDFIRYAAAFFFGKQQSYEWRAWIWTEKRRVEKFSLWGKSKWTRTYPIRRRIVNSFNRWRYWQLQTNWTSHWSMWKRKDSVEFVEIKNRKRNVTHGSLGDRHG